MIRILTLLVIILMTHRILCAQLFSPHKTEAKIAGMTPDQRVEEFCKEHARHTFDFHTEYRQLILKYLLQDGLRAIPRVIKEIEAYDPTSRPVAGQKRFRRYEAAAFILSQFDGFLFRVRAFEEGRQAIEALKLMSERLRIADFKSDSNEIRRRYELNLLYIRGLEGTYAPDMAIRDTLNLKYNIYLSDQELTDFIDYLITSDPYYPSWSESKIRWDLPHDVNNKLLRIYDNPEPFYKAYMKYKSMKHL